jgi:alpha-L-fucosidase
MKRKLAVLCMTGMFCLQTFSQAIYEGHKYFPVKDPKVKEKLAHWQDVKFGLLMHWGSYSQWGIVESWSICPEDYGWCQRKKGKSPQKYYEYVKEYESLQTTFNPTKFAPEKWAKAAANAGMKYVVFTTKHHDGFCMFDSKYTDYKITSPNCPFSINKRANVTKEIFDAFRAEGMMAGAYFSKPDWNHPNYWDPYFPPRDRNVNYDPKLYPEKWEKYVQFTHNQILELMQDYGKIDILWLDGGWVCKVPQKEIDGAMTSRIKKTKGGFMKSTIVDQDIRMSELAAKCRVHQPGLIVVDRAVDGPNQNYLTPENRVPEKTLPYPWESCIIAGGGWSYAFNAQYMSGHKAINMLIDIVCKGGNLLFNIAPSPDGTWDQGAYDLLEQMGGWIKVNGEGIYNSIVYPPYKDGKFSYTQSKDKKTVFAFYKLDEKNPSLPTTITIPHISKANSVELLGYGKVKFEKAGKSLTIKLPNNFNIGTEFSAVFKVSK